MLLYRSHSFFFNDTAPTEIYTLSLHDALPIWASARCACSPPPRCAGRPPARWACSWVRPRATCWPGSASGLCRSEEHTSELQSRFDLVCRLLLEKKKKKNKHTRSAGDVINSPR